MEENNVQKPKKGMSLICFIAIGIVLIILVFVGINAVIGNKESEILYDENGDIVDVNDTYEEDSEEDDDKKTSKSKYDGTVAYGTETEFESPKFEIPEKAEEGKWFEDGEDTWYYDLDADGNAINVYGYLYSFTGDVVIPDTIDGHKVISIGDDMNMSGTSFFDKSINSELYWNTITSITVPDGVKYINDDTFYGLENLESITLPDSVIYLGDDAFAFCKKLSRMNSENDGEFILPKNIEYLGRELFRSCSKLGKIEFPENINYINNNLFSNCSDLKEFTVTDNIEHICDGAFSDAGLEKITIGKNLKTIGWMSFYSTMLEEIELPNTVESIDNQAFYFSQLKKFVYNGKLKYIGTGVFDYTELENPIRDSQLPK